MMKIPLTISHGYIVVNASVRAPRVYGNIEFVVDTGSTETFISEGHALQLQLPIRRLKFVKTSYGLGGSPFNLRELENVTLSFKTSEGDIEKFQLKSILVAESTGKRDERTRAISLGSSSILGTDFLQKNRLKLYFDPINNVAYLEKSE